MILNKCLFVLLVPRVRGDDNRKMLPCFSGDDKRERWMPDHGRNDKRERWMPVFVKMTLILDYYTSISPRLSSFVFISASSVSSGCRRAPFVGGPLGLPGEWEKVIRVLT